MCEEFHCLPSAALREWRMAPMGFLEEVIEARAYAATKHLYETTTDKKTLSPSPMVDLVKRIEFALAQEFIDAHGG